MTPLVLLALAVLPSGDEKIELKHRPQVGDRMTKAASFSSELTVESGGEASTMKTSGTRRFVEEILAVKDGEATKVRRHFVEAVTTQAMPGGAALRRTEEPVHGKTVTLSLENGKTKVEGAAGLDPETTRGLRLEGGFARLLPKVPAAPGDRWEYPKADFFEGLRGQDLEGSADLVFRSIEEFEGERCARLAAKMRVREKNDKGITTTYELDGEILVTVSRGLPVSFAAKGTMTFEGTAPSKAMQGLVAVRGSGPVTLGGSAKLERATASAPAK